MFHQNEYKTDNSFGGNQNKSLIIVSYTRMRINMIGYMTLKETSEKWGISARRINVLCAEGRIPGAQKMGNMWIVPTDAEHPSDGRVKTGKYIKKR